MNDFKVLKENEKMVMVWVKDSACGTVLSRIHRKLQVRTAVMSL